MSDEKRKPFATVVVSKLDPVMGDPLEWTVMVDGRYVWTGDETYTQRSAERLNAAHEAAVEQREAKLRGRNHALRMIAAEMGDAGTHLLREFMSFSRRQRLSQAIHAFRKHMLEVLDEDDEYVPADVACGLAFAIGIERGTVEDLALMIETLTADERHLDVRRALAPFLRAKGLIEKSDANVRAESLMDALTVVMREGENFATIKALRKLVDDAFAKSVDR